LVDSSGNGADRCFDTFQVTAYREEMESWRRRNQNPGRVKRRREDVQGEPD